MPGLDDDRFRDLLQLVGELRQQIENVQVDFRRQIETSQQQTEQKLLEHWKAAVAALRQLSDWQAVEADHNRKDREERQKILDEQLKLIQGQHKKAELDRLWLQRVVYVLTALVTIIIILAVIR